MPPGAPLCIRYSWEAMAKIVIDGQTYAGLDTCVTCYGTTGEQASTTFVVDMRTCIGLSQ